MQPTIVNMHAALRMLQMLYTQQLGFATHAAAWHGRNESGSTMALCLGLLSCRCHGFCLRLELLAQHE